jgi:hypothetical protein
MKLTEKRLAYLKRWAFRRVAMIDDIGNDAAVDAAIKALEAAAEENYDADLPADIMCAADLHFGCAGEMLDEMGVEEEWLKTVLEGLPT